MNKSYKENIPKKFEELFKNSPLTICSPGRINVIGEHTDYNNGFVLPAAINKGIVTSLAKNSNGSCNLYAYDLDEAHSFNVNKIQALEAGCWQNYIMGVVAELQKAGKTIANFDLVFGGDIPNGSGLSSSAAIENSVVFGLNELFSLGLTKDEMILISQKAEHNYAGVKCGIMDQFASMFGIENHTLLLDCKTMDYKTVSIDLGDYQFLLINTNVKHSLSESAYNDRRSKCEEVAEILNKPSLREVSFEELEGIKSQLSENTYQKALFVLQENQRVENAIAAMNNGDIEEVGNLLFRSHSGLQNQYEVSCEELDFLVEYAKKNTAIIGSRMMGGGFGGCTINLVKKSKVEEISNEISAIYKEKFNKDCSIYDVALSNGTHVLN